MRLLYPKINSARFHQKKISKKTEFTIYQGKFKIQFEMVNSFQNYFQFNFISVKIIFSNIKLRRNINLDVKKIHKILGLFVEPKCITVLTVLVLYHCQWSLCHYQRALITCIFFFLPVFAFCLASSAPASRWLIESWIVRIEFTTNRTFNQLKGDKQKML